MVMMDSASMDRHRRRSPTTSPPHNIPRVRRRGRRPSIVPGHHVGTRTQAMVGAMLLVVFCLVAMVAWQQRQTDAHNHFLTKGRRNHRFKDRQRNRDELEEDASYDPASYQEEENEEPGTELQLEDENGLQVEATTTHSHLRHVDQNQIPKNNYYDDDDWDAIVVGSGLAGMTAALTILDRGGRVVVLEKAAYLGGNSAKASSGMNACCHEQGADSMAAFVDDTTVSAGGPTVVNATLIQALVGDSYNAWTWLQDRVGVDLSQVAQLGGHAHPRTHRPKQGMVGAELMTALERHVRQYEASGNVAIYTNARVVELLSEHGNRVTGVRVEYDNNKLNRDSNNILPPALLHAPSVVLATGGFASDRHPTTSILAHYRPDLLGFGTTGGAFSTGDGISLATRLGANLVGMKDVQLHPTGFVDPADPTATTKPLAAELLRGVGGILLNNRDGQRFCNELGRRDDVVNQMMRLRGNDNAIPTFTLLLSVDAAAHAQNHVDRYVRQGWMTKLEGGWDEVASYMNQQQQQSKQQQSGITAAQLQSMWTKYKEQAQTGTTDEFGKSVFSNDSPQQPSTFFVGQITPVLHYCMGGIAMDAWGRALNAHNQTIPGLFAAGEVTGGVHGKNRLGGNSLLECTVFGRRVGQRIHIFRRDEATTHVQQQRQQKRAQLDTSPLDDSSLTIISHDELGCHKSLNNLWTAVHGVVYNLTSFAPDHPGGASVLIGLGGIDATPAFDLVHSPQLLSDFRQRLGAQVVVGRLLQTNADASNNVRVVTKSELRQHATADDCWVILHGHVYDVTRFSVNHRGGAHLIQKHAGKDATSSFKVFHKEEMLVLIEAEKIGVYLGSSAGVA